MTQVIVGIFPSRQSAEDAIVRLKEAGFDPTRIGFIARNTEEGQQVANDVGLDVGTGAITGGVLGGGLGAILAATGAFVIPGVGPFIAAGILATAIAGGAAGAIAGALVGLGVPHEEAQYYHRRVVAGASLVTVDTAGREPVARVILLRNGAEDTWNTTPWQNPAQVYNTQAGVHAASPRAETATPVAEPYAPPGPFAGGSTPTDAYNSATEVDDANRLPRHMLPSEEAHALDQAQEQDRQSGQSGRAASVGRGSIVGPGDAVQHAGETNPFAGNLTRDSQSEGTVNYDEPALGRSEPPLDAGALPPNQA